MADATSNCVAQRQEARRVMSDVVSLVVIVVTVVGILVIAWWNDD